VIVFLDTEFTDLVVEPRLLSIAMVGSDDSRDGVSDFYAEVSDLPRLRAASWYALDVVLPQFGQVPDAACRYAVLCRRLADYLSALVAGLRPGESVELLFEYHLDWTLLLLALQDSGTPRWAATLRRLRPCNVYSIAGGAVGKQAALAYFQSQRLAALGRHHALCDARALRLAWQAASHSVAQASGDLSQHAVAPPALALNSGRQSMVNALLNPA